MAKNSKRKTTRSSSPTERNFSVSKQAVGGVTGAVLGAMVGGLLEYGALIAGYRALLIAVAALYGLAFIAGRKHLSGMVDAQAYVPAPAGAGG